MKQEDFLDLWRKMIRINHFFGNAATRHNAENHTNITLAQIKIFCVIADQYPRPLMLKDIATHLNLTPGAVSQTVDTLSVLGFLERNSQPNDRRSVAISLSAEGKRKMDEVYGTISHSLKEHLSDVPHEKLVTFMEVLNHLDNKLENETTQEGDN